MDKTRKTSLNINLEVNIRFFRFIKENKKKVLWIVFSAFLFSFAITSFLTKAATIPSGLSAISTTISYIAPVLKPYLNFIYLGLNIPLFLIFWKKIKKQYVYLTSIFLVTNAIFGFFIGFDFAGKDTSLDYWLSQYIFVFCPPTTTNEHLYANTHNINNIVSVTLNDYNTWLVNYYNDLINNGTIVNDISEISNDIFKIPPINGSETIGVSKGWPIFVYMLSAVVLAATSGSISWKIGGSTGGTDIIAYYYSTKRKKSVGSILMFIGIIIDAVSVLLVWSLSAFGPNSIANNINGFKNIISLQTLSSIIYIILYGRLLNAIYPKYSMVLLRIDTLNIDIVKNYLSSINYKHAYKIYTVISGRTGKPTYIFESVVLTLEADDLIKKIKIADPTAWISKLSVKNVYGAFDYSSVE